LVDLARRQRKPADDRRDGDAGDGRRAQILAPDKLHLRRGIYRRLARRPGDPAPGAPDVRPAAVVRNGVAPRRVIHPGPAPRVDPSPMAVAVRGPPGGHAPGGPDVAVGRVGAPGAVGIEILVAD